MTVPKPGDRGAEVKRLQRRLVELGYELPRWGPDGDYGAETVAAVKAWQADNVVDGAVDEDDWMQLFPPEPAPEYAPVLDGQHEVIDRYGKPWKGRDAWWAEWGAACPLPPELKRLTKRGALWVNRDIVDPLRDAFEEIVEVGLAAHVKTFDGCFSIRMVRGSDTQYSTHTWALAVDLNAYENRLGQEPKMHPGIVEAMRDRGFVWGGNFRRKDGMHFQRVKGF